MRRLTLTVSDCGRSRQILISFCMSHSIIPWIRNSSISKLQSSIIYFYRPFIQNYESFLISIGTKNKNKKNLSPQEEPLTKYLRFSWSNNLVLNYRTLARRSLLDSSLALWQTRVTQTVFLLTISIGQVKRIKKINNSDFLVDPIPNHLTEDHKNCIADSKENHWNDFGSERVNVRETPCFILGSQ